MRGLPATGLWGGGAPAAGRPTAHREHGRGGLCSGGLSVWEEARAPQGGCRGLGRLREALACGGIGRKGRLPDGAHWQGRQALRLARRWPMRDLYRQGATTGRPTSMPRYDDRRDLRAQGTGDGPRDNSERVITTQHGRRAFLGDGRERGPVARGSRQWETGPARMPRWRGGLRTAHGAAKPAERLARRRRSRARPSSVSAGQHYFDCTFLQKIELCDKNGRYESCR
jgi:hypothetical protein